MNTAPLPKSMMSAISVLDSLVRAGMRQVVLSPGSRNAPLTYAVAALDQAGALVSHVRIDERSAGFTALGLAKASGAPVGVITTSGTAVGELLPAVMEAYHSGLPLVILSADRPPRLRGTGSNQTTHQAGMLASFVRAEADLVSYPEENPGEQTQNFSACLAALTGRSVQNWSAPSGQPLGPVHINCAFDTPLTPQVLAAPLLNQWAQSLSGLEEPAPLTKAEALGDLRKVSTESSASVVVAGDGAGPLAQEFAAALNLPLLAEPSSGARFSELAIPAYVDVLKQKLGEEIRKVVLFGHPTLSRAVSALLNNPRVETALYTPEVASWYSPGRRREREFADLRGLAEFAGRGDSSWLTAWQEAGQEAWDRHREAIVRYEQTGQALGREAGMKLALTAWQQALDSGEILVCGSSNLIRDLDTIAPVGPQVPVVYASRGLAGIDGTIATATGISLASADRLGGKPGRVRLICGDLTFLHDLSSLNIGPLELKPNLSIEVLDDCGGGIFSTLEHGLLAKEAAFARTVERYFTTPHSLDLAELAAGFGQDKGISVKVHRV